MSAVFFFCIAGDMMGQDDKRGGGPQEKVSDRIMQMLITTDYFN